MRDTHRDRQTRGTHTLRDSPSSRKRHTLLRAGEILYTHTHTHTHTLSQTILNKESETHTHTLRETHKTARETDTERQTKVHGETQS